MSSLANGEDPVKHAAFQQGLHHLFLGKTFFRDIHVTPLNI